MRTESFTLQGFGQDNDLHAWSVVVEEGLGKTTIKTDAEQHAFLAGLLYGDGVRDPEAILKGIELGSKLAGQDTTFPLLAKRFCVYKSAEGYVLKDIGGVPLEFRQVVAVVNDIPGIEMD